jgi:thioredoxin reductase/Pyruvate/2-oxoacid:ferredoxin oxidoreductase delta subunit
MALLQSNIAVYGALFALVMLTYLGLRGRSERRSVSIRRDAVSAGLTEPSSLHPLIDPGVCIGCGACVHACPETNVLGLIGGKAELVEPTHCIGHGACHAACPTGAITLVFGTASRGVDIPVVHPNFETNVPGLFIAGELGGMGLIRNAVEQARQAIESIKALDGIGRSNGLDVVIVGAGPAGISATLAAKARKLRSVTVEQDSLGGTVAHYPRGKVVMTAPVTLPLVGKVKFTETSKEALLKFWSKVVAQTGLKINFGERVERIDRDGGGFAVKTTRATYRSRAVLLAIGRRGTPRKLGVPGEDLPKVVYRLIDPEQYRGQHVLVVGGGDSALEAAASLAEERGTKVTLSYRSDAFGRAKPKNRQRVEAAAASGRATVLLKSEVKRVAEQSVELELDGRPVTIRNDAVIVCAGGILPTEFLKGIGIAVETKYGTA